MAKIKFSKRHRCDIALDISDNLTSVRPNARVITKIYQHLRNLYTIRYKGAKCKTYFRSYAAMLKEKKRHLLTPRYNLVIHPFSVVVRIREIFMFGLWLFLFIIEPFLGSFMVESMFRPNTSNTLFDYLLLTCNMLVLIDVIFNFFMGYCIEQTREIILEPKRIAKHYLLTFFLPDLIPICVNILLCTVGNNWSKLVQIIVFQGHMLRFLRIYTMVEFFTMILEMFKVRESIRTCIILFTLAILIVHWWTCFLNVINVIRILLKYSNENSWATGLDISTLNVRYNRIGHRYLEFMEIAMCHFYGAGINERRTESDVEAFFFSIVLMNGMIFYVVAIAVILQVFGMINVSETKYDEMLEQTKEYMVTKKFPPKLYQRVEMYYNFKFDKKFFLEEAILASLSEHLRMEVLLYSCRNLIDKVQIFKGLSKAAVGCILAVLKHEIYLPGDVILEADDSSDTMYFILFGTCAIKMVNGKELVHVEDGNHFGDTNKMIRDSGQMVFYNFVALEVSQIYYLEKKDLKFCCTTYPEIGDKIRMMAKLKMRSIVAEMAAKMADEDAIKVDDLVMELRKGRILMHGRRR